ncbi:hypothetical protein [Egibacter rhizosphaerae]|nr:hypothetical protein [Egibacter rhizosphaerae]
MRFYGSITLDSAPRARDHVMGVEIGLASVRGSSDAGVPGPSEASDP